MTTKQRHTKREAGDREALERGRRMMPNGNDMAALMEFTTRGIPAGDIETFGPGQNVRTYRAWRALGRQVRKGEKSVRLTVWRPIGEDRVDDDGKTHPAPKRPCSACVFHISQTDPVNGKGGAS